MRIPAVALAVVGGLSLVGGTVADWVVAGLSRDVGGVVIPAERATSGTAFAALAIPLGVLAVVGGPALALGRRSAALATLALGVAALAIVTAGTSRAALQPGDLGPGPGIAGAGAAAVAAAGVLGLRPPTRRRAVVDDPAAREWELASEEDSGS